ncbi:MAG: hypothetical protein LQ346_005147 [Caloplaca aetnensis]|nr:MAG: hypothetical protein LQ346_005147 [Caloplaca aetnensis]
MVYSLFILVLIFTTGVVPDFLGPTYPAPKDLSSDKSHVATAWGNLTSALESYLTRNNTASTSLSGLKDLTFSIGMFSLHDLPAAESLQYHHTSAEVANSTTGVTKVNGNSIYRIASLTKLFTAFAGMLVLNERDWDRSITDFIPSLADFAAKTPGDEDPVNIVQWEKVTLAALASQLAGVPRDVAPLDGSDYIYRPDPIATYGLPSLSPSDPIAFPPCRNSSSEAICIGDEWDEYDDYAEGGQARPPTFLPWTSPQYTDFGFMLLGLAIANITNKSIHDVYRESIFLPLNMSSSSSLLPPNSTWKNHVIPGDISNGLLDPALAPEVAFPSGGLFSTTNDLAKWGTGMLNSTLLPPEQTRKWMKPVTFTENLQYAVGRTWEIYRYIHPTTGIVTDMYTKAGDSGAYGGYIVLLPDFDAGFSIIGTSSLPIRGVVTAALGDIVTEHILPALLAQAETEADRNFAGTYTSPVADLNTTLTLSLNQSESARPGLVISSFISNGTDVLNTTAFGGPNPVRLLPSISDGKTRRVAFRTSATREAKGGLLSGLLNVAFDWVAADVGTYGGLAVGLFVFDTDAGGRANVVRPAAWRVDLERSS